MQNGMCRCAQKNLFELHLSALNITKQHTFSKTKQFSRLNAIKRQTLTGYSLELLIIAANRGTCKHDLKTD